MKTKIVEIHAQKVRVKVYPTKKAIGASNFSRYHAKNATGTTLASAQRVSRAKFGKGLGCKSPDTTE